MALMNGYDKRPDEGSGAYIERLTEERDEAREVAREMWPLYKVRLPVNVIRAYVRKHPWITGDNQT